MDTQHTTCRVDFGIPEKVSEVNWIPHQPSSECDEYFQRHAITHVFRNVGPAELGQAGTHFYTVHRLVLHQHVEDLNHLCCGLAELMAGEKVGASVASSVGGFHSPRDFLKWPEVSETLLPEVFKTSNEKSDLCHRPSWLYRDYRGMAQPIPFRGMERAAHAPWKRLVWSFLLLRWWEYRLRQLCRAASLAPHCPTPVIGGTSKAPAATRWLQSKSKR